MGGAVSRSSAGARKTRLAHRSYPAGGLDCAPNTPQVLLYVRVHVLCGQAVPQGAGGPAHCNPGTSLGIHVFLYGTPLTVAEGWCDVHPMWRIFGIGILFKTDAYRDLFSLVGSGFYGIAEGLQPAFAGYRRTDVWYPSDSRSALTISVLSAIFSFLGLSVLVPRGRLDYRVDGAALNHGVRHLP